MLRDPGQLFSCAWRLQSPIDFGYFVDLLLVSEFWELSKTFSSTILHVRPGLGHCITFEADQLAVPLLFSLILVVVFFT